MANYSTATKIGYRIGKTLGVPEFDDVVASVNTGTKAITLTTYGGTLNQYAGHFVAVTGGDYVGDNYTIASNTAATPTVLTVLDTIGANLATDTVTIYTGSTTVPSTISLAEFMNDATKMINAEKRVSSNMTDTYGELATIEIDLVLKMIRNMWSFTNPDDFPYEEVILSADQKRIIHRLHDTKKGTQWELGG